MKTPKAPTPITEGITRRFFIALDAIIKLGKVSSLEAFCNEFGLSAPRYRETRLTYGVTPTLIRSRADIKEWNLKLLLICVSSTTFLLNGCFWGAAKLKMKKTVKFDLFPLQNKRRFFGRLFTNSNTGKLCWP